MAEKRECCLSPLVWLSLEEHPYHFLPSFPAVGKVQLKSKRLCWIPGDNSHSTTLGVAAQLLQNCQSTTCIFRNHVTQPNRDPEGSLGGGHEQTRRSSMRTVRQLPKKQILRKPSDSGYWPCQHEDVTALCSHGNLGKRVCICNSLRGFP